MIKRSKLKKIGLHKYEFQELVVTKIVDEKKIVFVEYFYKYLHFDEYFSSVFKWDYEYQFKDLDFIKDIRKKLISNGISEENLMEWMIGDLIDGDKCHLKIIEDKLFKTDFDYVMSIEIEMGKDSDLSNEIKIVEKELYKQLKHEYKLHSLNKS